MLLWWYKYTKLIEKDSKSDCSIRIVDCFIGVIPYYIYKWMQNWFWLPEYTVTVSGNLRNPYQSALVKQCSSYIP